MPVPVPQMGLVEDSGETADVLDHTPLEDDGAGKPVPVADGYHESVMTRVEMPVPGRDDDDDVPLPYGPVWCGLLPVHGSWTETVTVSAGAVA